MLRLGILCIFCHFVHEKTDELGMRAQFVHGAGGLDELAVELQVKGHTLVDERELVALGLGEITVD